MLSSLNGSILSKKLERECSNRVSVLSVSEISWNEPSSAVAKKRSATITSMHFDPQIAPCDPATIDATKKVCFEVVHPCYLVINMNPPPQIPLPSLQGSLPTWLASTISALHPNNPLRALLPTYQPNAHLTDTERSEVPSSKHRDSHDSIQEALSPFLTPDKSSLNDRYDVGRCSEDMATAFALSDELATIGDCRINLALPDTPTLLEIDGYYMKTAYEDVPFSMPGPASNPSLAYDWQHHTRMLCSSPAPSSVDLPVRNSEDPLNRTAAMQPTTVLHRRLHLSDEVLTSRAKLISDCVVSRETSPDMHLEHFEGLDIPPSLPIYFDSPIVDPRISGPLESAYIDLDELDFKWKPFLQGSNVSDSQNKASVKIQDPKFDHGMMKSSSSQSRNIISHDKPAAIARLIPTIAANPVNQNLSSMNDPVTLNHQALSTPRRDVKFLSLQKPIADTAFQTEVGVFNSPHGLENSPQPDQEQAPCTPPKRTTTPLSTATPVTPVLTTTVKLTDSLLDSSGGWQFHGQLLSQISNDSIESWD